VTTLLIALSPYRAPSDAPRLVGEILVSRASLSDASVSLVAADPETVELKGVA
jgi:hypothetical protein